MKQVMMRKIKKVRHLKVGKLQISTKNFNFNFTDFDMDEDILESSNEVGNSSLRDFQPSSVPKILPMVYIVGIYGK